MLAFTLTAEQAELFFKVCQNLGAKTEEERTEIMFALAEMGLVTNIVKTNKTKEEYAKHLADKFGTVLNISNRENI